MNINDFSEVTSSLNRRIHNLNELLNRKDFMEASIYLHEIQEDLKHLQMWIYDAKHEDNLRRES